MSSMSDCPLRHPIVQEKIASRVGVVQEANGHESKGAENAKGKYKGA